MNLVAMQVLDAFKRSTQEALDRMKAQRDAAIKNLTDLDARIRVAEGEIGQIDDALEGRSSVTINVTQPVATSASGAHTHTLRR